MDKSEPIEAIVVQGDTVIARTQSQGALAVVLEAARFDSAVQRIVRDIERRRERLPAM